MCVSDLESCVRLCTADEHCPGVDILSSPGLPPVCLLFSFIDDDSSTGSSTPSQMTVSSALGSSTPSDFSTTSNGTSTGSEQAATSSVPSTSGKTTATVPVSSLVLLREVDHGGTRQIVLL
jgi:hypothetical protein